MREDVVLVVRRDGGIGNERARLKRWITVWREVWTRRRVRRWGRASGSLGAGDGRGGLGGDAGCWLGCLVCVGDEGGSVGGGAVSRL